MAERERKGTAPDSDRLVTPDSGARPEQVAGGSFAVLTLQRLVGNRAVTTMVQRKAAQAPTLDESGSKAGSLPEEGLTSMSGKDLEAMGGKGRLAWYEKALGRFQNQLQESAGRHGIPEQLLAVVVLNELGDIDYKDVWQMTLKVSSGSLGLAQLEVSTAVQDFLLPTVIPEEAARLLRIPQWNIEAAAGEIKRLTGQMARNLDKPWQQHFGYTGGSAMDLYTQVNLAGVTAVGAATGMVVGAYNSPGIIQTTASTLDRVAPGLGTWEQLKKAFPNATIHASNAVTIANEVAAAGLFKPDSSRPAPHSDKETRDHARPTAAP